MNAAKFSVNEIPQKKKRILKLIFISLIFFIVLIGVIESTRLLFVWLKIENATRFGARYATTGNYDLIYCVDQDSDDTSCNGVSKNEEIDAARIPSIKDEACRVLQGINYDETSKSTDANYLKITVCSDSTGYFITYPQSREPIYAKCTPTENAGLPDELVAVSVDYNFKFIVFPFFGIGPRFLHLASYREGIVESFRNTSAANTPAPLLTPNAPTSVNEQLSQIDEALSQTMQSSFAYNAPESMKLNETITMELLLNPSVSTSELEKQVTESGIVTTGTFEITPRMKAELIAQDKDAFVITQIPEDPIQLMSATETTQWKWLITAKKGGPQILTLVVYRLLQYQGQDYWREVTTYKTNINVNVSVAQRIQSIDWKWLIGILITALIIPAFWRWIDNRKKEAASQLIANTSKKSKPAIRKENTKRKPK